MRKIYLPVCFVVFAFNMKIQSQINKEILEDQPNVEKVNQLLDTISALLIKNYIFPEMAEKMVSILSKNYKENKYREASSSMHFANMINQDLFDISGDKHIELRHREIADKLVNSTQPSLVDTSYGISKVEILPGSIGYLKFNYFPPGSDEQVRKKFGNIFTYFKTTSAIIIDLTDNFGGNAQMEAYLCSYFFDDSPRHLWDGYYRPGDTTYSFYTQKDIDGIRHPDIPVYILTSSGTFSAGEAFAYDLQAQKRAKIIGETTGGGAHATAAFDIGNDFIMRIPVTKITNAVTNRDWEGIGVKPDITCIQYEALDIANMSALNDAVSKTKDKSKKKLLTSILKAKQRQEIKFIKTNEKLKEYAGNYGIRKVIYSKGSIYFQREDEPLIPMQQSEKDLFIWGDNRTKLKFSRNPGGAVIGFDIIRPNETITVKKE